MSLGNEPYIERDTGKPLEGRLTVYLHDTDTVATVYTLEGPDFVEAENPQLVHGGSVDDSLFAQTGIYDLRLERYIGTPGQMSPESPDSDFEQVDVLECGIDFDLESMTANQVDFVADLRNVAPEMGAVTVRWYESAGDCVPRTYIWDAASVNTEDGGYVIGSNVSDTGRWILLWDDEQLPASVYGVTPGNESNMGPLLNYPDTVGSFGLKTAPIVRFQAGTYSTALSYTTSRTLAFDSGAMFTGATFVCPSAIVNGKNTDYIADFIFNENFEAHSSWFRTVNAFWRCASKKLVIDSSNHFVNYLLQYNTTISGATIIGVNRIPTTYSSTSLTLDGCAIVGTIFDSNDFVKFIGMEFHTSWFSSGTTFDFGRIANGNHIQCTFAENNAIMLDNFEGVGTYLKCIEADGTRTDVDLQGRRLNSYSNYFFAKIRNAFFGTLSTSVSLDLVRVDCDKLNVYSPASMIGIKFCHVSFGNVANTMTTLTIDDSIVSFQALDQMIVWDWSPKIDAIDSIISNIYIDWVNDNSTKGSDMSFTGCSIMNGSITSKRIFLSNCSITGVNLTIRPYYDEGEYRFWSNFVNCRFYLYNPITFDMIRDYTNPDTACHDIHFNCKIIGNTFQSSGDGIKMPYWAWKSHSYFLLAESGHNYVYDGNYGICPKNRANLSLQASSFDAVEIGGVTYYRYRGSSKIFPDLNSAGYGYFTRCAGGFCMVQDGSSVITDYRFFQLDRNFPSVDEDQTDYFKVTIELDSSPSGTVRVV
jgi:hypothetical protein